MLTTLACMAAMLPQGPGSSTAPVVINEFSADDTSADNLEYVELYNRTNTIVSLGGWSLRGEEGDAGGSPNLTFTFPPTAIIQPGDFLVVGNAAVPNVDLVVANNFLENGPAEGITLRDPLANVVDSVVSGYARWTAPVPSWLEGTPINGRCLLNETVVNPMALQRRYDGYDDNNNGCDFLAMTWTPGMSNSNAYLVDLNFTANFDGPVNSGLDSDFATSFFAPTVVNPAAVPNATGSTIAVPPSPQGGNIGRFNDITGAGNANLLAVEAGSDFLVDCYVYVAGGSPNFSLGDGESWAIGIGTTDSYAAPPDIPGNYYSQTLLCNSAGTREPGATGVAWFGFNTSTHTAIYLVDLNDGGSGFTVLAGPINATAGNNSGWQRLRLRTDGTNLTANFGGTIGCDNGQRFQTTLNQRCWGQPYFQYRECLSVNSKMTPLLVDQLEIFRILNTATLIAGTASPWTNGTPTIAAGGGPAVVGNSSFNIAGGDLVPSGISALVMGLGELHPGFSVPGTAPTLQVYISPDIATELLFTNPLGQANFFLPVPCANELVGLPLTSQFFTFDLALPYPVPVGTSPGMRVLFGN
ncbi:MAG: lamin tail domain-containing protein [Planctomycetota bacterium]|nr:lamin tail domain-containing protein [Planctomycetota bacterium]